MAEAVEPCDPLGGLPASPPLWLEEPWLLAVLPLELLELELEGSEGVLAREEELEAEGRLGTEEEFEGELEGDGNEGLLEELGEEDELGMLGVELELEEELVVSQPASPRHKALAAIMARGSLFILDILLPVVP